MKKEGPYNDAALRARIQSRLLRLDDPAWRAGMRAWEPPRTVMTTAAAAKAIAFTPSNKWAPSRYGILTFVNPAKGYCEKSSCPWLWTLLFGGICYAVKGIWSHIVAGFLMACLTCELSWLIYPFFARGIVDRHYYKLGWHRVRRRKPTTTFEWRRLCGWCF